MGVGGGRMSSGWVYWVHMALRVELFGWCFGAVWSLL